MGILVGTPAIALLGLVLSALGLTGLATSVGAIAGGFVGFVGGGALGGIKFKVDYSKKLIQDLLIEAMQRTGLTLSTLERTLKHHPRKLKHVSRGLTQLAANA